MHKNIILLSDGTGNSSAALFKTNVWRVYKAVDLTDPKSPKEPRQFACYDNGVGSSSFKPLAVLGGALGVGLARNVRDLYAFASRTYEPGDKIYAFGFSRGAFTIRTLVGLIMDQGLVPYKGNEADLDVYAKRAYQAYRKCFNTTGGLVGPLRWARDRLAEAWDMFRGRVAYSTLPKIGGPGSETPLEIEFIGLWDTVDAYGLPVDELTRAIDMFIWPLTMRDLNLNRRVKRARHALAIDDERNTFHPRLWNEEPQAGSSETGVEGGNGNTHHIDNERISQVWFAGVHSNVGGGYADDSLAHVSLEWIMCEADKYGLRFSKDVWDQWRALSDENGPIYDSRHGIGGYYRYNPRRIEKLTNSKEVVITRPKIHESVFRRIKAGQDGYAPIVLPSKFAVVKVDGAIVDCKQYVGLEPAADPEFAESREHVWNWVWWRRVAYFWTLASTLVLLAMPLKWPGAEMGACVGKMCFISPVIDVVAAVLPGFTATWFNSFASHPHVFLVLAVLIGGGLAAGGWLGGRIRDSMRSLWYGVSATKPSAIASTRALERPGLFNRAVEWLRTRRAYQATFRLITYGIIPTVFLVAIGYATLALFSRVSFAYRESWGNVCMGMDNAKPVDLREDGRTFRTNELCASTGLLLDQGATYRVQITIPRSDPWTDNGITAGPNGLHPKNVLGVMTLGVPLRRHIGQPWFKPMARIGATGTDDYPLEPKPSLAWAASTDKPRSSKLLDTCSEEPAPTHLASPDDVTFESEFVARTGGELFLYVNDAVLISKWTRFFYCNNQGTARVTVERVL
jgi:uncharacterized protein (DUF2235 family)